MCDCGHMTLLYPWYTRQTARNLVCVRMYMWVYIYIYVFMHHVHVSMSMVHMSNRRCAHVLCTCSVHMCTCAYPSSDHGMYVEGHVCMYMSFTYTCMSPHLTVVCMSNRRFNCKSLTGTFASGETANLFALMPKLQEL